MALTIPAITSAAVFLAAVYAHSPCPAAHITHGPPGMPEGCHCTTAAERLLPAGTRVYSYDQYVILDARRNEHFSNKTKFSCDRYALHVYDPASGAGESFSLSARIVRWKDAEEVAVRPGHPMPGQLKRDVTTGIAHFKMLVKK